MMSRPMIILASVIASRKALKQNESGREREREKWDGVRVSN